MSGQWAGSDRRLRLPGDWASRIVPEVKERDQGRCRGRTPSGAKCPNEGTEVDHIVPGDDHRLHNLQLLCTDCHTWKTQREAAAGRRRAAARLRYPRESHPGVL